MERLIDGSFLEDRCKRQKSDEWNKKAAPSSWADAYEQFLTDIENCPTVDAMPVVRCKDCANYAGDWMYCAWGLLTGDMGYCHHGYVADRAAATEETGADGERKGGDE